MYRIIAVSDAFDAIPEPAKSYVYRRLYEVLSGHDTSSDFARLSVADRTAALEILIATKRGLPAEWTDSPTPHSIQTTHRSHP